MSYRLALTCPLIMKRKVISHSPYIKHPLLSIESSDAYYIVKHRYVDDIYISLYLYSSDSAANFS